MGSVVEATAETFRELVSEGAVLVDVWGPRCQPCLALAPHVERLADERSDVAVVKLDASKARRLCMELRVMGLPSFLLFVEGRETARLNEPNPSPDRLREWLDAALGAADGDGTAIAREVS